MAGILVGLTLERFPARDAGELCVALALSDAADPDGSHVYPSVARVARLARCSERGVQYALQRFRQIGFLVVVSLGGGRGRPTRYRIDRDWLESQPSVLPERNGAPGAPILETVQTAGEKVQKPRRNGAQKTDKRCTNGAQACAPNPPPVYPPPTTPSRAPLRATQHEGKAVVDSEKEEKSDLVEELIEAAEKKEKELGHVIKNPPGWRAVLRRRLSESGPTQDDLALLADLKKKKEGGGEQLAEGEYTTPAGSRVFVDGNVVTIEKKDGEVLSQPLAVFRSQIAASGVKLTAAAPV